MAIIQNLFQVYKLPSNMIVEHDLNIEGYTKRQAIKDGTLVAIGDNLVFHKIRDYHNDTRTTQEIFDEIRELRKTLKLCKKEGKIGEARITNQIITDTLFVKDIINVEVIKKSEYKKLAKNGFYVNGIHYIRFLAGAGQIRRNTATFVNSKIYPYLQEALMCGLEGKIKEINLAKLGAYFALAFSSVLWVRTPRVCVVNDFTTVVKGQTVDFICKDEHGEGYVEERTMDIPLNSADGQGLVDPAFSRLWAEDMKIDFIPSAFIVRSAFIKGSVVPFDFKEYARREGISTIKDYWGKEYDIEDIDVILSVSQFKMYEHYKSWQEYLDYFQKYNLRWGVARYNKKHDDEYVLANYQYLQVLNINRDDIKELIAPTIDWLQKICSGDLLYGLLFILGCKSDTVTYQSVYGDAQTNFVKAVIKNVDMLRDGYVRQKIYKSIAESIEKAKIGKIWIRGNYQFMISDPVAQCRNALGLSPDGLVPADHIYSNFWRDRGVSGYIDVCRSPMIDAHEHNPSKLFESEDANYWYQYIRSGIILSIYDTATVRMEDADFDGDIVLTTDNPIFLKGSQKWRNVITYEKQPIPLQKVTYNNIINTDIRGFGTGVGGFSNCATILEAMRGIFNPETQQRQIIELENRKKLLREIVGNEIDRIKGVAKPVLPSSWKHVETVYPDDTDAEKAEKYYHNSLVISKKPYFFRYLYPELNKRHKQYEASYNVIAKDMFGEPLKRILAKRDKTEAEMTFARRYFKYSPLIVSNCIMNLLCKEFENVDFDIKYRGTGENLLPLYEDAGYECDPKVLEVFRAAYRRYCNKKQMSLLDSTFDEWAEDAIYLIIDSIEQETQEELYALKLPVPEMLFYIGQLSKEYKSFNWSFAWSILEDFIIDYIPQGKTLVPVRDEEGQEYLGGKYSLKNVSQRLDFLGEMNDN